MKKLFVVGIILILLAGAAAPASGGILSDIFNFFSPSSSESSPTESSEPAEIIEKPSLSESLGQSVGAGENRTISTDGDTVYVDDANAYLSAKPHTLSSSGWVEFIVTPKTYTGDIDICWGFDTSTVKPTKAEYYSPYWNNWTTTHSQTFEKVSVYSITTLTPDFGEDNEYNQYHYTVTYQQCSNYNEITYECEEYETVTSVVYCSDSTPFPPVIGEDCIVTWIEKHSELIPYIDVSGAFESAEHDYGGMNTWYYKKNFFVTAGNTYKLRMWVDMPISTDLTSGKYFWAVKPSSEEIGGENFYALDPWYSSSYGKRKQWTVTNVNATALTNFPAYINVSDEPEMQADYDDVVFTDINSVLIPFELENYTASFAHFFANTTIPASSSVSGWMYYDNAGATSLEDMEGVWDSSYKMVHHLQNMTDSTSYNNDGTNNGATYNQSGMIDGAYDFNGASDYVNCGNDVSLNTTDAITIEVWAKPSGQGTIVYRNSDQIGRATYNFRIGSTDKFEFYHSESDGNQVSVISISDYTTEWTHIGIVAGDAKLTLYRDGIYDNQANWDGTTFDDISNGVQIGRYFYASSQGRYFDGTLDEVRISSTARSADWINQSYEMVVNQSTWVTWGAEEVVSPIIALITQTPSLLYQNTTGIFNVSWGITHASDGLNNSSVAFIYTNTLDGTHNFSLRVPSNDRAAPHSLMNNERILRADNRNGTIDRLNFEDNATITGGNIYEWGGADENSTRLTIVPVNSTYTIVNWNGSVHDTVFQEMWYLDRSEQQSSTKIAYPIYRDHPILVKIWNVEAIEGETDYLFSTFADTDIGALLPKEPLYIYYLNSSYDPAGAVSPEDSPYGTFITSHNETSWIAHEYNVSNSKYVKLFVVNQSSIAAAGVQTTNTAWLYFTTKSKVGLPYYMNVTNAASTCNISFAETNVTYTGITAPFSEYAYTPNMFVSDQHGGHQFQMKLFAADNNGYWGNSTLITSNISVSNFPPTTPSILHFWYNGAEDYYMNDTYYGEFDTVIGVGTDPEGGDTIHNLTLHYANGTYVATINNTFNASDAVGGIINVTIDSSLYYGCEDYTLKVTVTDNGGATSESWLGSTFQLHLPSPIITTWYNNETWDTTLTFYIEEYDYIYFNATANQTITTWTWIWNGTEQTNNFDNITICFDEHKTHTVSVYGTNANCSTQTITWTMQMVTLSNIYEQNQLLIEENQMIADTWLFLILLAVAFGLSVYSWLGLGSYFYTDVVAGALAFTIFFSVAFYSITTLEEAWLAILATMFGLVQTLYVSIKVFDIFRSVVEA